MMKQQLRIVAVIAAWAVLAAGATPNGEAFGVSVREFGAKGDGVTDSPAESAAAPATGFHPCRTPSPVRPACIPCACRGREPSRRRAPPPSRSPPESPPCSHNIVLEGEMPCRLLNTYRLRKPGELGGNKTVFNGLPDNNTRIFSDWSAPEERNPEARPWAMIAAPQGTLCAGKFSVAMFAIRNLEFRAPLDPKRMYPTLSAANLQNVGRVNVQDSQFCLDRNIGDYDRGLELQPNPCHTVGLMMSGDQNDNQVLRNVAAQGFRYGFVLGEHTVADYLYVHNCEEGVVFHDSTHLSLIRHIVAQHCQTVLSTTRGKLFGHRPAPVYLQVDGVDLEAGRGTRPAVSAMRYGVYDPENRLHGTLKWHGIWDPDYFPVHGAQHFKCTKFGD